MIPKSISQELALAPNVENRTTPYIRGSEVAMLGIRYRTMRTKFGGRKLRVEAPWDTADGILLTTHYSLSPTRP